MTRRFLEDQIEFEERLDVEAEEDYIKKHPELFKALDSVLGKKIEHPIEIPLYLLELMLVPSSLFKHAIDAEREYSKLHPFQNNRLFSKDFYCLFAGVELVRLGAYSLVAYGLYEEFIQPLI